MPDSIILKSSALVFLLAVVASGCSAASSNAPYTSPAVQAEWDKYQAAEADHRFDAAIQGFRSLCNRPEPYPRACYDLSRLLFELKRKREAVGAAVSYIRRFPSDALAPSAVKMLARSYDDLGAWEDGAAALSSLAAQVRGTDVHDSVLYNLAWLEGRGGRIDDEAATLATLVAAYGRWQSQLWDDAIWRLIEICRDKGDVAEQERLLEQLLDTREKSKVIGSYNSPYYDDALLMQGEMLLGAGKNDQAYDKFMELADVQTSRLKDEGLFGAASARFAASRPKEGCALLDVLVRTMPRASVRGKALAKSKALGCGSNSGRENQRQN
jgi:tetratricopeptide (TPR) repeat protein